jgi:hypothetical protein
MIINTALTLAIAAAFIGADRDDQSSPRAGGATDGYREASSDSQPRRRLGVLGCALERDRQQALRTAFGDKSRFPPTAEAN